MTGRDRGATAIADDVWSSAIAALEGASRVALACHIGPDGDALGSMLALGLALRDRGCEVVASWGAAPVVVPAQYDFMPGADLLVDPDDVDDAPPVMVTFDAGSLARLGSLAVNAEAAGTLIVVDHHASNERFGTIDLLDTEAAASAVIVYDLLARMDLPLDDRIATCLYTGLVTDTGRFQYANTTPTVHAIAGELIAAGAPHVRITERIYNTHPIGYLRLASIALDRLREEPQLVWTYVTRDDLDRCAVGLDDIEALIDLVRTVDGSDVAVVLKQQSDGAFKVSMRSRGGTDVGAICGALGGGGHALAAGFTTDARDPHAAVEQIIAAIRA